MAGDVETSDGTCERFGNGPLVTAPSLDIVVVIVFALSLGDPEDCVGDIALVFVLHRGGEFALAFALRAVLAEDAAAKDFDFRYCVIRMRGVLAHRVDEVLFVAVSMQLIRERMVIAGGAIYAEQCCDLLFLDVGCQFQVMSPLNQRGLVLDIFPHRVDQASALDISRA